MYSASSSQRGYVPEARSGANKLSGIFFPTLSRVVRQAKGFILADRCLDIVKPHNAVKIFQRWDVPPVIAFLDVFLNGMSFALSSNGNDSQELSNE